MDLGTYSFFVAAVIFFFVLGGFVAKGGEENETRSR